MKRAGLALATTASVVALASAARAQPGDAAIPDAPDAAPQAREPDLGGEASGSLRSGYWSSDRNLDARYHFATLALWMRATPRLGSHASLAVEGWVRSDDLGRSDAPQGLLREAYVDVSLGSFDLRAGKQIIAWGRADGINPTDNLSPRNLTLLVPDDGDQRSGTYALRARYFRSSVSVAAWWLPGLLPDVVPIPALPPPLVARETSPSTAASLGQAAFKVEQTGGTVDWSVSYFDGFDRAPDLGAVAVSASEVDVLERHHRIRVIGADAAANVGRIGLRAEAAYTFTENRSGRDPETKHPGLFAIVGLDRTFGEYLNANVQYLVRVVMNYESPFSISDPATRQLAIVQAVINGQPERVQQGGTFRISDKWLDENLEAEISGIFYTPRFSYALRGKASYALDDHWKGVVGFDYFAGESPSLFQLLRMNSTVFSELRRSF